MAVKIHDWNVLTRTNTELRSTLMALEKDGWEIVTITRDDTCPNCFLVVAKRHSHYKQGDGLQSTS